MIVPALRSAKECSGPCLRGWDPRLCHRESDVVVAITYGQPSIYVTHTCAHRSLKVLPLHSDFRNMLLPLPPYTPPVGVRQVCMSVNAILATGGKENVEVVHSI